MMTRTLSQLLIDWRNLLRDARGGALVDYAIVAAAFGALVLTGFALIQTSTAGNLARTQNNLTSISGTP
jgi:Flp pilus assembly pilin Flp